MHPVPSYAFPSTWIRAELNVTVSMQPVNLAGGQECLVLENVPAPRSHGCSFPTEATIVPSPRYSPGTSKLLAANTE